MKMVNQKEFFSVVLAAQHDPNVALTKLRADLETQVIKKSVWKLFDNKNQSFINATGRFVMVAPRPTQGLRVAK